MAENTYQAKLIKKLESRFPGCIVMKNDPNYIQGIPDLTLIYNDKWALLEVKDSANAPSRPNQDWYISWAKEKSFGAKIYPENEEEVLNDIQQAFES